MKVSHLAFSFILLAVSTTGVAETEQWQKEKCLVRAIQEADDNQSVEDIKKQCEALSEMKGLKKRIAVEKATAFDPYIITPHKMNYILPVMYTDNLNRDAYASDGHWQDAMSDFEAKIQLSIKVPLSSANADIFTEGDGLAFGFTLQSWWQLYAEDISRPFRETNYQPEIFYYAPLDIGLKEGSLATMIGLEHQSNGRSQLLSRSWNRVYINFIYIRENFAVLFRPWYRIPEEVSDDPNSPNDDDNPDIADYMGHFELGMAYQWNELEFSFKGRQNFSTHKGGMELGVTFPITGRLKGYVQYTSGYGESLIDYNHSQNRLGIGIALTDIM